MSEVGQSESLQRVFCQGTAAGSIKAARIKESSAPGSAGPAHLPGTGPARELGT